MTPHRSPSSDPGPRRLRTRALAGLCAATAVAALAPSVAAASGGTGGGGGGGGTSTGGTAGPCASISLPKPSDSLNTAGKASAAFTLQFKLTSCSTSTQTDLQVLFVDDAYMNTVGSFVDGVWVPADCSLAPWTSGPFTLKPGETRSFAVTTAEPPGRICTHLITETLGTTGGTTFNSVVQRFDTTQRI